MILLEPGNRILGETVSAQIKAPESKINDDGVEEKGQREPIDVRLSDFDDVSYRVLIDVNSRNTMKVSMALPCYPSIADKGGRAALETIYAGMVDDTPADGFDMTLSVELENNATKEAELTNKLQMFKSNVIGGVFDHFFAPLLAGKPLTECFKFNLRPDTTVFFIPRADRVTVVFSLCFPDKVDTAIAKVFMQEFAEARKRLAAAPPCTFTVNPPLELKEFGITEPIDGNLGFISFAVMKSHLENGRKEKVIAVLQVFRNYLQYHLKCSKAYFHSRMRARVVQLLKLLNRAKFEVPVDGKAMKTISGKTFIRH